MTDGPDDLLVRLINHRISEERSRREDYLTECFAWLLTTDAHARAAFLDKDGLVYRGGEGAPSPADVAGACEINTQERLSASDRPDIVIRGESFLLIVEAKVDAPFDKGQIRRYLKHVKRHPQGKAVALLPLSSVPQPPPLQAEPDFLGVVAWEDVATLIDELPEVGGSSGDYRRWFLRLLEHYGLVRLTGPLAWVGEDDVQQVEEVRQICGVLDGVVSKLSGDLSLAAAAPMLYRHRGIRLGLTTRTQSSGAGSAPRPILNHDTEIGSGYDGFFNLRVSVFFQSSQYTRGSQGCRLTAQLAHWAGQRGWAKKDLPKVRQAMGRALPADDDEALALLSELHEPFIRRCEDLMLRFADNLKDGPLPLVDDLRCYRDWGLNIPLAASSDLIPIGSDVGDLSERYEEWLRAIIDAWFTAQPMQPLIQLVWEASTR